MGSPAKPSVPIDAVLAACEPLGRLGERLRESQARLATIQPLLPAALRGQVRSGPLDDDGWTLLVPNGAVSAKLRQLMPALESALVDAGWPGRAIRVRILNAG